MAVTDEGQDPQRVARPRGRTGRHGPGTASDLAVRRSAARQMKAAMIDGIAALEALPTGLGAPVEPVSGFRGRGV